MVTYLYPLDIFKEFMHNKPIGTLFDAWLTFFTTNDLARIEQLIQSYPEFADIYQELFEFRNRPEELINMFQKALHETDRSTERYMVDMMREEIKEKDGTIAELGNTVTEQSNALTEKDAALTETNNLNAQLLAEIAALKAQLKGNS